ncbi:MAG TPA: isochorismatase family cysteine hydrolase [Drouetiella sp.]
MGQTALLVMDLQNAIIERIGADDDFLSKTKEVISAARRANVQVIYVSVKFRDEFPEVSPNNKMFSMLKTMGSQFNESQTSADIHPSVKPEKKDILVTKRRVGAFSGSDLEVVLRSLGVDHLVLTGIATSGVVLSTLRAAADLDYKITVLSDLCKDRDEEVHKVLTEKVFPMQADVMSSKEWEASLKSAV